MGGCAQTATIIKHKAMDGLNKCGSSDLIVNLKVRKGRFKAGADLSNSIIRADVDWNENQTDQFSEIEVKLHLTDERCAAHQVIKK
jgi:hypothetical protein